MATTNNSTLEEQVRQFNQDAEAIETWLNTFPEEYQTNLTEYLADMLYNIDIYEATIRQKAEMIVEDGKDLEYLLKSHDNHASEYALPTLEELTNINNNILWQQNN